MFAINRCARILVCLAALGLLASPVLGATPIPGHKPVKPQIFDVKLVDGRRLLGQVVNANGSLQTGSKVVLLSKSSELATTNTDDQGRFYLPVPKPGAYRVVVEDRAYTIRAWKSEVAPPKAKLGLLCVVDDAVRGQCGGCGAYDPCGCTTPQCPPDRRAAGGFFSAHRLAGCGKSLLRNPAFVGVGVAAAIALPIALDDDDDDGAGAGGAGEPAS